MVSGSGLIDAEIRQCDFFSDLRGLPDMGGGLFGYSVTFDVGKYSDDLFDRFRIRIEPQLARAVEKRKAEFLAGRMLARTCLKDFGLEYVSIGIGRHREPLWPPGIVGSISHTRDTAVCVVSAESDLYLGIDIETMFAEEVAEGIKRLVIDRHEQRQFEGHLERAGVVTTAFSAKESLFKALFAEVGGYFDFLAVAVDNFDEKAGIVALRLKQDLAPSLPAGSCFEVRVCPFADGFLSILQVRRGDWKAK